MYASYESDVDTDTDSDLDTGEDDRKELVKPAQFGPAPDALTYVHYAPPKYELTKPTTTPAPTDTNTSQVTSIVVINSRDRDRTVYPDPTFFTLRLPRVYRNVKNINLTEISILNSFFNFTAANGNITIPLAEARRPVFSSITIREGTYTSDTLVTELQSVLNLTPLFTNLSFSTFQTNFKVTSGDFTILFNIPNGQTFNYETNQYDVATTNSQIASEYFNLQETFGYLNFTNQQCLVAYFYPCIKQMILQYLLYNRTPGPGGNTISYINTLPGSATSNYYSNATYTSSNLQFNYNFNYYGTLSPESSLYLDPRNYLLFGFQGLNDRYTTSLVTDPTNQAILQAFHNSNTFLNYPVNEYTCIYNSQSGRFQITAPNINPSISTDLQNQYNTLLNAAAYQYGYQGVDDLQSNLSTNTLLKQVGLGFYNFIHKQLTDQFGINFGTYTTNFFLNTANEVDLYNTKDKVGWIIDSNNIPLTLISTSPTKLPDVPVYWPNLQFLQSTQTVGTSTVQFCSSIGLSPNLDGDGYLQFSNASEHQIGYFDVPFSLEPTTYARLNFQSKIRQTIELLTIPRYTSNRTAANDEIYFFDTVSTPFLFSSGISLVDPFTNPNFLMYSAQHVLFNTPDYMRFEGTQWLHYVQEVAPITVPVSPAITDIKITPFQPYILFQINAADILVMPDATFDIDIYVETQDGSPFPVPLTLSWYRDRSAFMADVQELYTGNYTQNPAYYFVNQVFEGTNSARITCKTLSGEASYLLVTIPSPALLLPGNLPLRIFAVESDVFSIASITPAQRLDYRKLPYTSTATDSSIPSDPEFQDPLTSIFSTAIDFFQLGYDGSTISNNLLDWVIQGTNGTYYDPNSIEQFSTATYNGLRYIFKDPSAASATPSPPTTSWNLFFPAGTSNTILDLYTQSSYTTSNYVSSVSTGFTLASGTSNAFTLMNWFNPIKAKESFWNPMPGGNSNYLITGGVGIFQACINVPSSQLVTDMSTNTAVHDSNGIAGVSFFLPPGEVVSLQEVVLKFGYTSPTFTNGSISTACTRSGLYANPFTAGGTARTTSLAVANSFYSSQSCDPTTASEFDSWDDWYLPNRQNLRVGVYPTAQISSIATNALLIEDAIGTLSLSKVTQVNNYTYTTTAVRRRQPEWGTYYTYQYSASDRVLWSPSTTTMYGSADNWTSTIVTADLAPVYSTAAVSSIGYFKTEATINNYNGLERNYGLAPSVGNSSGSSWVDDIPNSYTLVPFVWNAATGAWIVGSWYGLTFTTVPQLPPPSTLGAAPYYGPPGVMGWTTVASGSSTFMTLASTGSTAFQPVYWNAKVSFNQLNNGYEPQNDLSAFGGMDGISGEFQDTRMFFYQNLSTGQDLADIYDPVTSNYIYGAERADNYTARNDNGGYNFLSFLPNLTVRSSLQGSSCEYALHVRGQVPTVQFTTGVRVMGKNVTDFGTLQLNELMSEISSLSGYVPIGPSAAYSFVTSTTAVINQSTYSYTNLLNANSSIRGGQFSFDYADALITFDRQFSVGTATFGINAAAGYPGMSFQFYNFSTALSSYSGFYTNNFSGYSTIIGIYAQVDQELKAYISTAYNGILPEQYISRIRYTDPIAFSLPFSTYLQTPYNTMVDQWGLGWNLGFAKRDTAGGVSQTSDTFIRIVADYLYLRLNESYNMNGISTTEPEDLSLTRDAMGQNQKYFAKIVLNDFGSISRTAVQMPKDFNPAINKFDTFSFELVDKTGARVVNLDCESDLTLQIVEERVDLKIDNYKAQNIVR
jgi:hypothetical protein